jgi:hypothetical protein
MTTEPNSKGNTIEEFNYINNKVGFSNNYGQIPTEIYKYFYSFPKPYEELFGKDIITTFYSTNYLFKKIEKNYLMMKNLIEINKEILNKNIDRNNYIFNNSNFIFFNLLTKNYNDDFNNLFNLSTQSISSKIMSKINNDDKDFISKFQEIDGVFNYLSNNKKPFFFNLFERNYNGKDKDFFISLFEEYNDIRNKIFSVANLKGNAGILSLEPFIKYNIQNNNSNNLSNSNNKEKSKSNENNFSDSLFFESNKNIYKGINIKNKKTTESKISTLSVSNVKNSTNYSLFYKKNYSDTGKEYSIKILEIFKELHKSLRDLVFYDRERELYQILLLSIKIDYLSLKFFYSFIESIKFKIITDTSIKINSYIFSNIELYNQYLPSFLSWRNTFVNSNKLSKSIKSSSKKIDEEGLIFEETLKQFFNKWNNEINIIKMQNKEINNRKHKIKDFAKGLKILNKALKPKSYLKKMENFV